MTIICASLPNSHHTGRLGIPAAGSFAEGTGIASPSARLSPLQWACHFDAVPSPETVLLSEQARPSTATAQSPNLAIRQTSPRRFPVCRCYACRVSSHPVISISHALVHFAVEPAPIGAAGFFIWDDKLFSSVSPVGFCLKHEMVSKPMSPPQGFVRPSTTVRYHDEKIVRRSGYARCSDSMKRGGHVIGNQRATAHAHHDVR